ncbi:DUF2513 domain-containing protein [Burkholderia ubonensis]|uniref:DUF2513 domain-containing protein n=1 Tax=Burkholderia ubonensis TaxID=101571 RepID=UPI0012F92688|nr:DUF2513 domain-containing protein [Burkholderia ubonensis]
MKRDNTLIQSILKALEESDRAYMTAGDLRETLFGEDKTKSEALNHHIHLLTDKGLIESNNSYGLRLTWSGHDALQPKSSIFG